MGKHYKKPIVRPEQARTWLARYESGETMSAIALKDHYDMRTIKRQIGEATVERDQKEARQAVLREALEKHFQDIVTLAEKMRGDVLGLRGISLDSQDTLLLQGLKQHLPRSPLWQDYNRYQDTFVTTVEGLKQWFHEDHRAVDLRATPPVAMAKSTQAADIVYRNSEKETVIEIKTAATAADIAQLRGMEEQSSQIDKFSQVVTKDIKLQRIHDNLLRELNTIILRRVVPGRCRYCPY